MTQPAGSRVPDMVDWGLALSTAQRLTPPGPRITRPEAAEVVEALRDSAAQARAHVREHTGLDAGPDSAPVLVVDRSGWSRANVEVMRSVVHPLVEKIATSRPNALGPVATAVGSRVTGLETGGLLSFLATKVLGQFDPFTGEHGRLLLVAPNVLEVQRRLDVDPQDFRLWVCLHEETHRVQFGAVPWLRGYVRGEIAAFVDATELDPQALLTRLRELAEALLGAVRGDLADLSLVELVQTPAQRAVFERLTAVMSLLEGHAEVVMDGVGPDVVPTVATIRERFQARRGGTSTIDRFARRVLGLDAKMRQYRDGAGFVRGVVDRVGMAGFNRVWESPDTLPRPAEIADPAGWVARVHGSPALGT